MSTYEVAQISLKTLQFPVVLSDTLKIELPRQNTLLYAFMIVAIEFQF